MGTLTNNYQSEKNRPKHKDEQKEKQRFLQDLQRIDCPYI